MNELDLKLCDIQGRLFELSVTKELSSEHFITAFMTSDTAKHLDSRYNKLQWMGEAYLLEEIISNISQEKTDDGEVFSKDVLYWIGYIYRYWHYLTGDDSKSIIKIAPVKTMKRNYMMFHTMDPKLAIEKLIEINQKK